MGAAPKSEIVGSRRSCIPTTEVLSLQVLEDRTFQRRLVATPVRVRRYQGIGPADSWQRI